MFESISGSGFTTSKMFVAAGSPGLSDSGLKVCTISSGVCVVTSIVGAGTIVGSTKEELTGGGTRTSGGGATAEEELCPDLNHVIGFHE